MYIHYIRLQGAIKDLTKHAKEYAQFAMIHNHATITRLKITNKIYSGASNCKMFWSRNLIWVTFTTIQKTNAIVGKSTLKETPLNFPSGYKESSTILLKLGKEKMSLL